MNINNDKNIWFKISREIGKLPVFQPTRNDDYVKKEYVTPWGAITIQGVQLNTSDEDVFLTVCNHGKFKIYETKEGDQIQTIVWAGNLYHLLKQAGKQMSQKNYSSFKKSIQNLETVSISFSTKTEDKRLEFRGNLFIESTLIEYESKQSSEFKIVLNARVSRLILGKTAKINMTLRNQLSPLGKALHRFLSCHHDPHISVSKLHSATAPLMPLRKFKANIKSILSRIGYIIGKNGVVSKNIKPETKVLISEDKSIDF